MPQRLVIPTLSLAVILLSVACAPTGVGDPCEPEVMSQETIESEETIVETSSLQCRTRVCMFYNGHSFCTQRCTSHDDCLAEWFEEGPTDDDEEWPPAYCEAEVTVGSPGVIGSYCVPERASDPTRR
jgi:hypothetical protein